MKAVLDCNVFISALIRPGGPPARILAALLRDEFEAVLSPAIVAEYRRAADYPKVRSRIALSVKELSELLEDVLVLAFWVEPVAAREPLVAADPSDDAYLLAAAESHADYVVSGDRHLLDLIDYEGIPVVPPRQFLQALKPPPSRAQA